MDNNVVSANLEKCVDGDTAVFSVNGISKRIRFLAIDTPESVHPNKEVEAYSKTASSYTCEVLESANLILLEYENSAKTDKYGRDLAWVWIDNELMQKKLVENGYAQVAYIYGNYKYTLNLCAVQSIAKKEKLNIWSDKEYEEGYCKTVDISGVSTDISLDSAYEQTSTNNWYIFIVLAILVIICIFNKKFRKKVIKKVNKKVEKDILKKL